MFTCIICSGVFCDFFLFSFLFSEDADDDFDVFGMTVLVTAGITFGTTAASAFGTTTTETFGATETTAFGCTVRGTVGGTIIGTFSISIGGKRTMGEAGIRGIAIDVTSSLSISTVLKIDFSPQPPLPPRPLPPFPLPLPLPGLVPNLSCLVALGTNGSWPSYTQYSGRLSKYSCKSLR